MAIASMSIHPGYSRDNVERPTLAECARIADSMLAYDLDRRIVKDASDSGFDNRRTGLGRRSDRFSRTEYGEQKEHSSREGADGVPRKDVEYSRTKANGGP